MGPGEGGSERDAEQFGDLFEAHVGEMPEDEDFAVGGFELMERLLQLACIFVGGNGVVRGRRKVGWVGRWGVLMEILCKLDRGGLLSAGLIAGQICCNAKEPWLKAVVMLVGGQHSYKPDKDLLQEILSKLRAAGHAEEVAIEPPAVTVDELVVGCRLEPCGTCDEVFEARVCRLHHMERNAGGPGLIARQRR